VQYDPNPKHANTATSNSKGIVSVEPTDPIPALQNSAIFTDKQNGSRRIGVNPESGQVVVFDETSEGVFHGHAPDFVTTDQANVLVASGQAKRIKSNQQIVITTAEGRRIKMDVTQK
jgi:DNA replication initiation complex subunit (GINS family)